MTKKELKALSKTELITLLYEREAEIEQIRAQNDALGRELENRRLTLDKAGSIAEESLRLSGVFKAAQDSADMYLAHIREMEEASAAEAERVGNEARRRAGEMLADAEKRCAEREMQEKQYVENLWIDIQERLLQFSKAHSELSDLMRKISLFSLPPSERRNID